MWEDTESLKEMAQTADVRVVWWVIELSGGSVPRAFLGCSVEACLSAQQ